jgi:tetratricopeptide repeat protein
LGFAVAQLEKAAPAAAGLLRLLACLAPEPVPVGPLLAGEDVCAKLDAGPCAQLRTLIGDPVAQSDAVAALRRYSLVTPDKGGQVSAHRLIQAVSLDRLSADMAKQWRNTAAALVEAAIPYGVRSPETWPACAVLFPHVQVALPHDSDGMTRIASYLGHSGDYAAARDLHQKIVLARERAHGSEHPSTLNARVGLARWTGVAGDRNAAKASYAALLPVMERVLGQEHPDTLAAASDMARWSDDPAVAREQYAALLPVMERVLGPEHPDTLTARQSRALDRSSR